MSKWIFGLVFILSLLGCQRKESGDMARLQLTLPASSGSFKSQSVQASGSANWNTNLNPSQISDINCYAILVSGPEPEMQKGSCEMKDQSKMPVGLALGLFPASNSEQKLSLEVPSGEKRVISIIGFVAAADGCASGVDQMKHGSLSEPHIIGQATADLVPGESKQNDLSVTAVLSATAAKQISDCAGIIQPDTTATTTTTTTSSTSTTTTTLPGNVAPVANMDIMTISISGGTISVNPLANDTDTNGDALTITAVGSAGYGTTSFTGSTVSYTPSGTYTGLDSFTYTITDTAGATSTATVQVKVMSPFTWIGAINGTWGTTGNWCGTVLTPGLAGTCAGGSPPSTSDMVVLNSFCSTCTVSLGSSVTIGGLLLDSSFTGSFSQGSFSMTIGTAGLKVMGGDFYGGNGSITVSGDTMVSTPGAFVATSGSFNLNSSTIFLTAAGTFNPNGGIIGISRSGAVSLTVAPGNILHSLQFTSAAPTTVNLNASNITIQGDLILQTSSARAMINNGNLSVFGNLNLSNLGATGTAVVRMVGTAAQTISGASTSSWIPNLEINKTAGILTFTGTVPVRGNYRWLAGSTNMASLIELIMYSESPGGNFDFWPGNGNNYTDVTFAGYGANYDLGGQTLDMTGSLILGDASVRGAINNGAVRVRGDIDLAGYGKVGNASIEMIGSTNQTITGNVPTAACPDLVINSTGGTVSLMGDILLAGNFTYTQGSVSAGTSNIEFGGPGASASIMANGMAFNNLKLSGTGKNINLNGQIVNVNGNLTLADTGAGTVNNGTIYTSANVVSTANGKGGTASVKLVGVPAATITQASVASKFPGTLLIYKSGTVSLASTLSLATTGQGLTIGSGTLNQNTYGLTVNGTLSVAAGATLNQSGASLSYGSLSNLGTLNP